MKVERHASFQFNLAKFLLFTAVIMVVAIYADAPALSAKAMSFDDAEYLDYNPLVHSPSWQAAWNYICSVLNPQTVSGYYRPVTMCSFLLDACLGGTPQNYFPFHRTSLILHALNSLLLFLLLWQLFNAPLAACVTACLFAAQPFNAEAVVWIAERKTVLASFFALAALNAYVINTRRPRRGWYVGAILLYALATLSKPTTLVLPLLMALLDVWPLRGFSAKRLMRLAPFLVISVVMAVITVISQERAGGVHAPPQKNLPEVFYTVCYNVSFYLHRLIRPGAIAAFYPAPALSWNDGVIVASVLTTMAVLVAAIVALRWTRALLVGFAFFLISILPTMNVLRFTDISPANRFAYLPCIGVFLLLGAALAHLWNRPITDRRSHWRFVAPLALVVTLVIAEAGSTHRFLSHWKDTETLMRHMVESAPGEAKTQAALGEWLTGQAKYAEAIGHLDKAIAADPSYSGIYNNYASALIGLGRYDEAWKKLDLALEAEPDNAFVLNNKGVLLAAQNRLDEAVAAYQETIRIKPDYAGPRVGWAMVLAAQGRFTDAVAKYEEALRLDPRSAVIHDNLGVSLGALGRTSEAVSHFQEALRLDPTLESAQRHLRMAGVSPPR